MVVQGHAGAGGREGYTFVPPQHGRGGVVVWVVAFISIVGGLLPAAVGIYYASARNNVQFVVSGDGLAVNFKVGRITIAADDIADVQYVPEPPRMGRIGGAALGDLNMGWYRWPEYGRVYRLTTAPGGYVVIDTAADVGPATSRADTRYVFDPAEGEAFVASLEAARAGQGPTAEIVFGPTGAGSMSPWPLIFLGVVLVLPVGIVMPWLVVRGRRDMAYHVGPEGITVHHLGEKLYRWSDIQEVTIRQEPLRGLLRTMGTAFPGYYAGSFRARSLPNIQMNATHKEPPLVIVQTQRVHLIVTPDDVGAFMEAVSQYRDSA